MVKSKELKRFRKAIEQAERSVADPLQYLQLPSDADLTATYHKSGLPDDTLQQCLDIFQANMHVYYSRSDRTGSQDYLAEKRAEFSHRTARWVLVRDTTSQLAALLHYRFCLDDDDDPTAAVLYLYELQIASQYQRQGLGRALCQMVLRLAAASRPIDTVMLTVHKANRAAMALYTTVMGMQIDPSSPSQHEEETDYEILSVRIGAGAV